MNTLGFTEKYFTLWDASELHRHYINKYEFVERVTYTYYQNLSIDYNKAIEKIHMFSNGSYEIDLDLRGKKTFHKYFQKGNDYPSNVFDYGIYAGKPISECQDVLQLNKAMLRGTDALNTNKPTRQELERRMYARKRLLEMRELLKINKEYILKTEYEARKRAEDRKKEIALHNDHFFEDKIRVDLKIKEIKRFGFESVFGIVYIRIYVTEDGKHVKYMGANPPDISETEFVKVVATICHSEYKGQKETKLQRIKITKEKI